MQIMAEEHDGAWWMTSAEAAKHVDKSQSTITGLGRKNAVRTRLITQNVDGRALRLYHVGDLEDRYAGRVKGVTPTVSRPVTIGQDRIYVVRPDPIARAGRVKVGSTTDLQGRLTIFRAIVPEAEVLVTYRVSLSLETYALALANSLGERVGTSELFDFTSEALDDFLTRLDAALSSIAAPDDLDVRVV